MSDQELVIEPCNAAPDALSLRAQDLFNRTGTVPLEYVARLMGPTTSTADDPLADLRRLRTFRGRRIREEHELLDRECPYPHEPDL